MEVNDEIAHMRVVDGLLRLGLPSHIGARIVGIDADDVELVQILELGAAEFGKLAAEHQMQQLFLGWVCGHDSISGNRRTGVSTQLYANSAFRSRTRPIRAPSRIWPAATSAPCAACEPVYLSGLPAKSVSAPPASCTKRSAAARSQSWLPREAKAASRAPCATRARRKAREWIFGCASVPCARSESRSR